MIIYFHTTVILSVILSGIFLLRWRKGIPVHFPLIFLLIPIINLGYLKIATAVNEYEALLANGISYLDGCFLELIFFLFLINFCKLKTPKALTAVLLTVGSVVFFFAINDGQSHLLYTSAELKSLDGVSYLVKEYGPVHTAYYVMIAIYLLANLSVIIFSFTRKKVSKINTVLLLAIYMLIIFAFLAGKSFHPAFELLPAAYTLSQILFLIVMKKITIYDISESALSTISQKGDLGFASFDLKYRYIGCTEPVLGPMPEFGELYIDKILKPENEHFKSVLDCIAQVRAGANAPHFYVTANDVTYKVSVGFMYADKTVIGYQLRTEDNTSEQKRLDEMKLREQQKELEARLLKLEKSAADAANKAKSSFLAEMSHEIRTPINAIIGMNEMIMQTSAEGSTLEYAANIDSSSKTLLALINSILDFSKLEDGKMELVPVNYSTADFAKDLESSVSERAKAKGLELRLDIDPTLPPYLYGDDVRLSQVIQNLLTNAVKYTHKGSVTMSIKNAGADGSNVRLAVCVKDTGIGIREEDLGRMFESFSRLDEKRNRNIEGTGLGMSIVTKLLTMMGSELKVESVYGQGSAFSFEVVQGIGSSDRSEGRKHGYKAGLSAPTAKILVVDDNSMNLKVAKGLLGLFGIVPELANSGNEAIALAKKNEYMMILLDHMMPAPDGVETLKTLRGEGIIGEGTKVVALSANAIAGARERYLAEGFDDYLSKPIELALLEKTLRRYLPENVQAETSAGDDKGKAEPSAPLKALSAVLDTDAGLEHCLGDEDFYTQLLSDYAAAAEDTLAQLESFLEQQAFNDYRVLVHSLKSSAKTVGDMKTADIARTLEAQAAEGKAITEEEHGGLCTALKASVQAISKALG